MDHYQQQEEEQQQPWMSIPHNPPSTQSEKRFLIFLLTLRQLVKQFFNGRRSDHNYNHNYKYNYNNNINHHHHHGRVSISIGQLSGLISDQLRNLGIIVSRTEVVDFLFDLERTYSIGKMAAFCSKSHSLFGQQTTENDDDAHQQVHIGSKIQGAACHYELLKQKTQRNPSSTIPSSSGTQSQDPSTEIRLEEHVLTQIVQEPEFFTGSMSSSRKPAQQQQQQSSTLNDDDAAQVSKDDDGSDDDRNGESVFARDTSNDSGDDADMKDRIGRQQQRGLDVFFEYTVNPWRAGLSDMSAELLAMPFTSPSALNPAQRLVSLIPPSLRIPVLFSREKMAQFYRALQRTVDQTVIYPQMQRMNLIPMSAIDRMKMMQQQQQQQSSSTSQKQQFSPAEIDTFFSGVESIIKPSGSTYIPERQLMTVLIRGRNFAPAVATSLINKLVEQNKLTRMQLVIESVAQNSSDGNNNSQNSTHQQIQHRLPDIFIALNNNSHNSSTNNVQQQQQPSSTSSSSSSSFFIGKTFSEAFSNPALMNFSLFVYRILGTHGRTGMTKHDLMRCLKAVGFNSSDRANEEFLNEMTKRQYLVCYNESLPILPGGLKTSVVHFAISHQARETFSKIKASIAEREKQVLEEQEEKKKNNDDNTPGEIVYVKDQNTRRFFNDLRRITLQFGACGMPRSLLFRMMLNSSSCKSKDPKMDSVYLTQLIDKRLVEIRHIVDETSGNNRVGQIGFVNNTNNRNSSNSALNKNKLFENQCILVNRKVSVRGQNAKDFSITATDISTVPPGFNTCTSLDSGAKSSSINNSDDNNNSNNVNTQGQLSQSRNIGRGSTSSGGSILTLNTQQLPKSEPIIGVNNNGGALLPLPLPVPQSQPILQLDGGNNNNNNNSYKHTESPAPFHHQHLQQQRQSNDNPNNNNNNNNSENAFLLSSLKTATRLYFDNLKSILPPSEGLEKGSVISLLNFQHGWKDVTIQEGFLTELRDVGLISEIREDGDGAALTRIVLGRRNSSATTAAVFNNNSNNILNTGSRRNDSTSTNLDMNMTNSSSAKSPTTISSVVPPPPPPQPGSFEQQYHNEDAAASPEQTTTSNNIVSSPSSSSSLIESFLNTSAKFRALALFEQTFVVEFVRLLQDKRQQKQADLTKSIFNPEKNFAKKTELMLWIADNLEELKKSERQAMITSLTSESKRILSEKEESSTKEVIIVFHHEFCKTLNFSSKFIKNDEITGFRNVQPAPPPPSSTTTTTSNAPVTAMMTSQNIDNHDRRRERDQDQQQHFNHHHLNSNPPPSQSNNSSSNVNTLPQQVNPSNAHMYHVEDEDDFFTCDDTDFFQQQQQQQPQPQPQQPSQQQPSQPVAITVTKPCLPEGFRSPCAFPPPIYVDCYGKMIERKKIEKSIGGPPPFVVVRTTTTTTQHQSQQHHQHHHSQQPQKQRYDFHEPPPSCSRSARKASEGGVYDTL